MIIHFIILKVNQEFMKKLLLFIVFCLSLISLYSQRRFDWKIKVDNELRDVIIVQPSHSAPPGGYPVVFMLHGTSGDGEKFYNISGWKELGEEENFITVFPSSLSWCFVEDGIEKHNTKWVNGDLLSIPCAGKPQDYVDDVKFLKRIVQLVQDTFQVNSKMIFASGFSNGSVMIHKLANDAGDVFAAVAGGSGPLTELDSTNPVNRIPVWFIVGSLDDRYIVPPYTSLPFGGDSILAYLGVFLNRALACQGLTQTFIKKESNITHTYIFNEAQAGMTSKPYLFTLIKDMTHEYPNGANYPLSAPKIFWEFFKQSVVTSTNEFENRDEKINIYPNPSDGILNIKAANTKIERLDIYNSQGSKLLKVNQLKETYQMDLTQYPDGIYFIQLKTSYGNFTKKWIKCQHE